MNWIDALSCMYIVMCLSLYCVWIDWVLRRVYRRRLLIDGRNRGGGDGFVFGGGAVRRGCAGEPATCGRWYKRRNKGVGHGCTDGGKIRTVWGCACSAWAATSRLRWLQPTTSVTRRGIGDAATVQVREEAQERERE